jgi:hypothetical protein
MRLVEADREEEWRMARQLTTALEQSLCLCGRLQVGQRPVRQPIDAHWADQIAVELAIVWQTGI